MMRNLPKDLVVLVADNDAANAVQGLLTRHQSLGVRPFSKDKVDLFRHFQRDSGCYKEADNYLRPFLRMYGFALVMFDRHGSGAEHSRTAEEIESHVEACLCRAGWEGRCAVIVPDPELEIWVWSDSPNVDRVLGWAGHRPRLREWLIQKGLLADSEAKPFDPKRAMLDCLQERGKSVSAGLFRELASQVSFDRCQDRAFLKLRKTLQTWFGERE
jgi:hypothetical protein